MKLFKKKKVIKEDFVVLDGRFPGGSYKGFRAHAIISLFNDMPNVKSYHFAVNYLPSTSVLKGLYQLLRKTVVNIVFKANINTNNNLFHYYTGITKRKFLKNKQVYIKKFPQHKDKICFLDYRAKYEIKLAYMLFVNTTYALLPFLESNNIPFVFVLTPGGGFGLNEAKSDAKLKRIFASKCFRKVCASQVIIKDYLLKKNFCAENDIYKFWYKRPLIDPKLIPQKKKYPMDKDTFDLVFVAYKYMEKGLDKGYDVFIDVAKALANRHVAMRFHVVGSFDENEIDVSDIKDKITFYGVRDTAFLINLYSKMDIFLSPNRPFLLGKGRFDGFPLGGHAAFCGVALFVADELKMNKSYTKEEIVIIKPDKEDVVKKVEKYFANLDALYKLSLNGQKRRLPGAKHEIRINEIKDFFQQLINES